MYIHLLYLSHFLDSYYSYPNITLNAPIEEYKTGTIMALTCCSQFDLPSQYAWNKRNMITYDIEPLTNAMGEFSSTLYVPITGVEDSGVYICIAYNVGGVSVGEILIDLTPEGEKHNYNQTNTCTCMYIHV